MCSRIGILAIRNSEDTLASYCVDLAEKLRDVLSALIVVSKKRYSEFENDHNAEASFEKNYLNNYYSCGMRYLNDNFSMSDYDELVMLDDSFFGPLTSFSDIFAKADKECPDADVWSISDLYSDSKNKSALHTYFLTIRGKAFSSKRFQRFFEDNRNITDEEFITEFSMLIDKEKLIRKSLFSTGYDENDPTIYDLSSLLPLGFPVVRREVFFGSYSDIISRQLRSDAAKVLDFVDKNTEYDVDQIYNSVVDKADPFELLSTLGNHFIVDDSYSGSIAGKINAVIVFHMHYDDLFEENLEMLGRAAENADVIITTTSSVKVRQLKEKSKLYSNLNNVKILCSEGNGRDMAGLLVEAREYLSNYTYIGFTHDKKSAHHRKASGEGFSKIISENILHSGGYVSNVIDIFEKNPRIGLLVPPPPEHAYYFSSIGRRWCNDYDYFDSLCRTLGIENRVKKEWSPFSLGTSFWCRYDALKTLFKYEWAHSDFPEEPLPLDGSISHAIERCLPYIAMQDHYLSGIIYTKEFASDYLNMREYILTDFFTQTNQAVSMEKKCYSEYKKNLFSALSDVSRERTDDRKKTYDTGDYRAYEKKRNRQREKGLEKYKKLIEKNKNARILVILHLYYMCSWKEIKQYLKNLDVYNYKLIVTYTSDIVDNDVLDDIRKYKPDSEIYKFPNLGYDIGSFTEVIGMIDLNRYDIIYKLQSKGVKRKRIYIYGQYLKKRDWFLNLFEGCIGAETVHITVDKLMNDPKIGLAAADNLIVEDPSHKQNMVKSFMNENGIPIPQKYRFVAGACFAVKAKTMKPVQELRLSVENYRSADATFSLAHKMERVVCLSVLNSGYDFFGNDVMKFRRMVVKLDPFYRSFKKHIGVNLLNDKRFSLDDEFVFFSLEHRLVKKYKLIEIPIGKIKRRWLNQLIPISECYPYKYLVSGDPAVYEEYCELNKKHYKLNVMSRERFGEMIKSIDEKGFLKENVIVVNQDNILMDGQHRCCYMLYKYGENYMIPCLKIYEYSSSSLKLRVKNWLLSHLSDTGYNRILELYKRIKGEF